MSTVPCAGGAEVAGCQHWRTPPPHQYCHQYCCQPASFERRRANSQAWSDQPGTPASPVSDQAVNYVHVLPPNHPVCPAPTPSCLSVRDLSYLASSPPLSSGPALRREMPAGKNYFHSLLSGENFLAVSGLSLKLNGLT